MDLTVVHEQPLQMSQSCSHPYHYDHHRMDKVDEQRHIPYPHITFFLYYKWRTESMSTTSKASQRIAALLDDNSFVEIGALVTARATDFNMKPNETPSDGAYSVHLGV